MEEYRKKVQEFFLNNFNIDYIFGSIERADYLFLYYIKNGTESSQHESGVYLSELAAAMDIPMTALSKTMKKLQSKGYIEWKTSREKDRTYVELTDYAKDLMQKDEQRIAKLYEAISREIPAEEFKQMVLTMRKVRDIMKAEHAEA